MAATVRPSVRCLKTSGHRLGSWICTGRACIIEMKRPAKDLSAAREQVKRYWEESSDPDNDVPAARWVVICSFQKIEVWEPGRFPGRARVALDLVDLPAHYDVLNFLTGPNIEPVFHTHHRHMTRQAAEKVAQAYQS